MRAGRDGVSWFSNPLGFHLAYWKTRGSLVGNLMQCDGQEGGCPQFPSLGNRYIEAAKSRRAGSVWAGDAFVCTCVGGRLPFS